MKTYSSGAKEKSKKGFFKRNMYALLFGTSLLLVAAAITLALVFTRPRAVVSTPPPVIDEPQPPVQTFVMPISAYTVGKEAALDSLVYSATLKQWRSHNGVDIMAASGAAVGSVCDGKVSSVTQSKLEGWVVTIEHDNGIVSIYKGLSGEGIATAGVTVKAGEQIGTLAETMLLEQKDGTHLHLEMKKDGVLVDPLQYLPDAGDNK